MINKLSICKALINELNCLIKSPAFIKKYCKDKHFIRKRKLSVEQLIYYLFYTSEASMNLNLSNIKDDIPQIEFPDVSKQAVSKARKAILPELFQQMLQLSVTKLYSSNYSRKTWHGFHVFAINSSRIQVPKTNDNLEYFGICRNQHHS